MAFVNDLYRYVQSDDGPHAATLDEAIDTLLQLLAPACPHMTAELWSLRHPGTGGPASHIHESAWPVADPSLLVEDTVTLVVQVNGKVRDRLEVRRRRRRGRLRGGRDGLGEGPCAPRCGRAA